MSAASNIDKHDPTALLRSGVTLSLSQRIKMVALLSWPAIMAQLSSILMEYIDAAMVGSLGAAPSASIGLVSTSMWLFWGIGTAFCSGFSVQLAHKVGANDFEGARSVLRQSLVSVGVFAFAVAALAFAISPQLPVWLGGNNEINDGASIYFAIFALTIPLFYFAFWGSSMLRCSGNMLVPGLLNVLMCILDVVFNFFMIFPSHTYSILGIDIYVPGAGMGVAGAAIGSALAVLSAGTIIIYFAILRNGNLSLIQHKGSFKINKSVIRKALYISLPMGAERVIMNIAQIIIIVIVAPLGNAALAANAFAVTAEALCYMPGYGLSEAATTLVGQSIGAGRSDLTKSFATISIVSGMIIMGVMGVVMWICAPFLMSIFTPDTTVRELGTIALRTEAWAEPMFAAAIVTYGVFVGAGYTIAPAAINLSCIWIVRISLSALLAPTFGLYGVWLAMCIELSIRGFAFIILYLLQRNRRLCVT